MKGPPATTPPTPAIRRFGLPVIILALMAAGYGLGLHRYLSLDAIAAHRQALAEVTSAHLALSLAAFMAVYAAAVALSFPGASVLTVLSGLLFGWFLGGLASLVAATLGAMLIFLVVQTSFGEGLARRAGPFLSRLAEGFKTDAFNYLLFLRLVPAFPFWLVNIAPALAGVRLKTFAAATAVGIIPGTFAFAFAGSGLDSVIEAQLAAQVACVAEKGAAACPLSLSLSSLITPELLLAFAALGVVALIPVLVKRWKAKP